MNVIYIFNIILFMPLTGGQEAVARLQSKSLLSNESLSPPCCDAPSLMFFVNYRNYVFGHTNKKLNDKKRGAV